MGGKVFSAKRVDRATHDRIYQGVSEVLTSLGVEHGGIPFCHKKKDFGDVDIVVVSETTNKDTWGLVRTGIAEKFGTEVFYNDFESALHMYGVDSVQVDLTPVPRERAEFHREFFGWNGINMIINIMLQNIGLKVSINKGFKLKYNVFTDYTFDRWCYYFIPVSELSMEKVCKVLDLDYAQYKSGFGTFEDIYRYVETSPYFTPEIFNLTGKKHKDRKRLAIKVLITEAQEYFKDYDVTQYPKADVDNDGILRRVAEVFGQKHIDAFKEEAKELYVSQESSKDIRELKSQLHGSIRDKYYPRMDFKDFRKTILNPCFGPGGELDSNSTLEQMAVVLTRRALFPE